MNNPYKDKMSAKKEMAQAKIMELKAKLKDASADVRINIQKKIDELQNNISSLRE